MVFPVARDTRPKLRPAASTVTGIASLLVFTASWLSATTPAVAQGSRATAGDAASSYASAVRSGAPSAPPVHICDAPSMLNGPRTAPAGAVDVTAAMNLPALTQSYPSGTTFWLSPGTHALGSGTYTSVIPKNNDRFIGAPGAVLDGRHVNYYAFTGKATGVTVEYLTVQNFGQPGGNNNEGVVNHDAGHGWTIEHDTVQGNAGAGVFMGSDDKVSYDCLRNNGQYGFSAYEPNGVSDLVLDHNEISGNNTDNWEARQPGCGCTGGGKFWNVDGAVVTDNYVHDNKSVGLWADTDNTGFDFEGNYISQNYGQGILYEISYNAKIKDNTFVRNGLVTGPTNPGFPTGAIYLSESGSDARVPGPYGRALRITGNDFIDNWSGVVLWENADRFCGSPANSSTGTCTLVQPSTVNIHTCNRSNIAKAPYFDDCRWKTQNVRVAGNTFSFTPSHIGSKCTPSNGCGLNGVFSNWGTYPSWSPYKQQIVEDHITFDQHNVFANNAYTGPWHFMAHDQTVIDWNTWRAAPYNQDAGSTLG